MNDTGVFQDRQHPWFDDLHDLEMELLDPRVRENRRRLDELMRDDFIEVGSSGKIYTKWVLIDIVGHGAASSGDIRDFSVRTLAPDVALVTYRSLGSTVTVRRSSIWVYELGRWQIVFHQGTRLPNTWSQGV